GRNGAAGPTRHPPAAVRTWAGTGRVGGPGTALHEVPAPDHVPLARGLGRFRTEGRYLEVDLADAPLTVASLYLPKGGLPAHLQRPARMREAPDGGARYARKVGRAAGREEGQ